MADVPEMAREFADYIPESGSRISSTEIQGYLMLYREDPMAAVAGAATWVTEIMETKARGALVAEFATEISEGDRLAAADGGADADDEGAQVQPAVVEHAEVPPHP